MSFPKLFEDLVLETAFLIYCTSIILNLNLTFSLVSSKFPDRSGLGTASILLTKFSPIVQKKLLFVFEISFLLIIALPESLLQPGNYDFRRLGRGKKTISAAAQASPTLNLKTKKK